MRRIAGILFAALELAALAGAYALDHYSRAKLGMNRWLVYHNQGWEASYPIPAIKLALAGLLIALLALAVCRFIKSKARTPLFSVACLLSLLLIAGTVMFIVSCDTAGFRAYYLICAVLAIASAMQVGWCLVVAGAQAKVD